MKKNSILKTNETPLSMPSVVKKAISGFRLSHLKKRSWRTKIAVLLVVASLVSCFFTYIAMTESYPIGDNPDLVIWLLNIDLIFLILLVSLIARRIVGVWSGRKRGIAGSRLHIRFVYVFSLLVAIPTIIMTVFSALFFHYGVQAWFSQRVQTAINESQAVAQSYLEEHKEVIRADTLAMANDLSRQADYLVPQSENFTKILDTQTFFRNLSEAIVIDSQSRVISRSSLTFTLEYETPPHYAFSQASAGDVVLTMNAEEDRVRALVKLENFDDAFLYVGRLIDPQVLQHLKAAQLATEDYNNLQSRNSDMQITVTLLFVVVGLLLLLAAIWSGLIISKELVNPIVELIKASDRVRAGDLNSRLPDDVKRLEEFDYLVGSFNKMTEQLQSQRNELVEANRQIDRRRHLTETVLSGVSSGVIGVNKDGDINLANNSAADLLGMNTEDMTGSNILRIFPEIEELLHSIAQKHKRSVQGEISFLSELAGKRSFLCRISVERLEDKNTGLIITFDDITELQAAQRKSAWADVARRIAHEIKNPLTPIQLSAERLKRKYLGQISDNPEAFTQCTDTIIRHVTDIGKMVDEFSSFARMPDPVIKSENIVKCIEDSLFLIKQAQPSIDFTLSADAQDIVVDIDARQVRQVITNLLRNSVDSIESISQKGRIDIVIGQKDKHTLFVSVTDDGAGFPKEQDQSKLTDPYVTHKPKGTGLGLAIVKKIMDDHNGEIFLGEPEWLRACGHYPSIKERGANVVLTFPVSGHNK